MVASLKFLNGNPGSASEFKLTVEVPAFRMESVLYNVQELVIAGYLHVRVFLGSLFGHDDKYFLLPM